jgi:hypothetical protein
MVDFELYYRQNPDKAPRIDLHWFTEESNKEVIVTFPVSTFSRVTTHV